MKKDVTSSEEIKPGDDKPDSDHCDHCRCSLFISKSTQATDHHGYNRKFQYRRIREKHSHLSFFSHRYCDDTESYSIIMFICKDKKNMQMNIN